MNHRQLRQQRRITRKQPGKAIFAGLVPAPIPTETTKPISAVVSKTTSTEASTDRTLSPHQQMLLRELHLLGEQINSMLKKRAAKILGHALVEGLKAGSSDSSAQ
jgi:mRNA-degrading endonuclease toxin of MazEF toxin-antitoxin module